MKNREYYLHVSQSVHVRYCGTILSYVQILFSYALNLLSYDILLYPKKGE